MIYSASAYDATTQNLNEDYYLMHQAFAAALGLVGTLAAEGLVQQGDIAVFTAMCMCWSGYLSTHVSMMNSLGCNHLAGKAIFSHTIGGLCAGMAAHWMWMLVSMI